MLYISNVTLSGPKNPRLLFISSVENMLLPYMVTQYGIKINLNKLKRYYELIKIYSRIRKTIMARAYETGLRLAIEAIENN